MSVFELGKPVPDFTLTAVSRDNYHFENYRKQTGGWLPFLL
ncbi:hypothetical protein [Virgibacillus sp. DJP39]